MGNRGNRGKAQSGFTLIELMIVVAVIGLLAAVVMPEVRGYSARAKVSEAMMVLTNCRNVVHEVYLSSNNRPGAGNWGCEADRPSKFVFGISTTDDGVIRLQLGNEINDLRLSLFVITLAPLNGSGNVMREEDLGTPVRRWRCGATVDGTDLSHNYLPSTCRGT
jgi:type IV pilus assembly protein PilA